MRDIVQENSVIAHNHATAVAILQVHPGLHRSAT